MKKLLFVISFLFLTTACTSNTQESADAVKDEPEKAAFTEEERDAFLNSNKYISEFDHTIEGDFDSNILTIKTNEDFNQLKISEQYQYLVDFYESYNEKYSDLLPNDSGFLNRLNVYTGDKEFPTYHVNKSTFGIISVHVGIDREVGEKPAEKLLKWVDNLNKSTVLSGKEYGLTLAEKESGIKESLTNTILDSSGEILVVGQNSILPPKPKVVTGHSTTSNDSETYIAGMDGYDWVKLTDNQRFHAVSNAFYSLDKNGYSVEESEYFFIDALNEFYRDNSTMSVQVNEALASIGTMSNTLRK